jgi:hypothetical protein
MNQVANEELGIKNMDRNTSMETYQQHLKRSCPWHSTCVII